MGPSTRTPAPGTRPRNRRALIVAAASTLFHRRGYAAVSVADIAAAVNVGGSALYRHFGTKADILVAAIEADLARYAAAFDETEGSTLRETLDALAAVAVDHPALGVLWQREARNLDDSRLGVLRERLRELTARLAARLRTARPDLGEADADLLAWCTVGALVSIGFHNARLSRAATIALLSRIAGAIAHTRLESGSEEPRDITPSRPRDSTKAQVIDRAVELFADRGFTGVGMDEIGAAVGIAGPSIYSHFSSKQVILATVMEEGRQRLMADTDRVREAGGSAGDQLRGLIATYVRLAVGDRSLIRILLSEQDELPDVERREARRVQREYIDLWVALRQQLVDEDAVTARIRVQAVLLVVKDVVQTPHLYRRPQLARELELVGEAVLCEPEASGPQRSAGR